VKKVITLYHSALTNLYITVVAKYSYIKKHNTGNRFVPDDLPGWIFGIQYQQMTS